MSLFMHLLAISLCLANSINASPARLVAVDRRSAYEAPHFTYRNPAEGFRDSTTSTYHSSSTTKSAETTTTTTTTTTTEADQTREMAAPKFTYAEDPATTDAPLEKTKEDLSDVSDIVVPVNVNTAPVIDDLGSAKALVDFLDQWKDDEESFATVLGEIQGLSSDAPLKSIAREQILTMTNDLVHNTDRVGELVPQLKANLSQVVASRRSLNVMDDLNDNHSMDRRALPKYIRCAGRIYTAEFIAQTITKACELFTSGGSVGVQAYPHTYNNRERLYPQASLGTYQEYPLKTVRESGPWLGVTSRGKNVSPGPDRLVFKYENGECKFIGAMMHRVFYAGFYAIEKFVPC